MLFEFRVHQMYWLNKGADDVHGRDNWIHRLLLVNHLWSVGAGEKNFLLGEALGGTFEVMQHCG